MTAPDNIKQLSDAMLPGETLEQAACRFLRERGEQAIELDNVKRENASINKSRKTAQELLSRLQREQAESGLCLDAALAGKSKRGDRYWDGRMEAVRRVVAENADNEYARSVLEESQDQYRREAEDLRAERDRLKGETRRLKREVRRLSLAMENRGLATPEPPTGDTTE